MVSTGDSPFPLSIAYIILVLVLCYNRKMNDYNGEEKQNDD